MAAGSFAARAIGLAQGLKVRAILFGIAVAIVGLALDLGMARFSRGFVTAEIGGNTLTGVLAGYAMYRYMAYRRRVSQLRSGQIAYLNHHIRNGLHLIMLSHFTEDDAQRLKLVQEASERIQLALTQFANEDNLTLTSPGDIKLPH